MKLDLLKACKGHTINSHVTSSPIIYCMVPNRKTTNLDRKFPGAAGHFRDNLPVTIS